LCNKKWFLNISTLPNIMIEKHNVSEYNSLLFFNKVTKNLHFSQFPFHLRKLYFEVTIERTIATNAENSLWELLWNTFYFSECNSLFRDRISIRGTPMCFVNDVKSRRCHTHVPLRAFFFLSINRALSRARNPLPINDKRFLWST